MRLAIFTNQFPSRVSTFFARDLRGLIDLGLEIDVFPLYPVDPTLWCYVPQILPETIFPRNKYHYIPLREALSVANSSLNSVARFFRDSCSIVASGAKFGMGPAAKTSYALLKAWALSRKSSGNYDHILAYWGSYAATYAYGFHRLAAEEAPFSMFLHAGDLYQDQVYLRQKLLYADNIFVVCDFNREYLRSHYGEIYPLIAKKIRVYHPGLDLSELPFVPDGRCSRRIVAVGRFDKCKGFDYLVRAIYELKRLGLDANLELIGDGEQDQALRGLVTQLGLSKQVKFRGWLPFEQVKDVMRNGTTLVHPSSELGDAVPTVIKEACALGMPVIASNVAGIPELLKGGACGMLVPPGDVAALASAIRAVLTDTSLRRNFAHAARKHAEETFDVFRNAKFLAGVLQSTNRATQQNRMIHNPSPDTPHIR